MKEEQTEREKYDMFERAEAESKRNTKILRDNTNKRMIE